MKTAVDWHKELIGNSATYVSVAALQQIQLDAWRQGMMDAAEIVEKTHWGHDGDCNAERKILNARDTQPLTTPEEMK